MAAAVVAVEHKDRLQELKETLKRRHEQFESEVAPLVKQIDDIMTAEKATAFLYKLRHSDLTDGFMVAPKWLKSHIGVKDGASLPEQTKLRTFIADHFIMAEGSYRRAVISYRPGYVWELHHNPHYHLYHQHLKLDDVKLVADFDSMDTTRFMNCDEYNIEEYALVEDSIEGNEWTIATAHVTLPVVFLIPIKSATNNDKK